MNNKGKQRIFHQKLWFFNKPKVSPGWNPKGKRVIIGSKIGTIVEVQKNSVGNIAGTIVETSWFFKIDFDDGSSQDFFDPVQLRSLIVA